MNEFERCLANAEREKARKWEAYRASEKTWRDVDWRTWAYDVRYDAYFPDTDPITRPTELEAFANLYAASRLRLVTRIAERQEMEALAVSALERRRSSYQDAHRLDLRVLHQQRGIVLDWQGFDLDGDGVLEHWLLIEGRVA